MLAMTLDAQWKRHEGARQSIKENASEMRADCAAAGRVRVLMSPR
jgi:hypothetical protein